MRLTKIYRGGFEMSWWGSLEVKWFFLASPKAWGLRHLTWKFVRQHTHTKCHTLKWCNLRQFSIISKSIRTHGPFNLGGWFLKNLMDIFAPFSLSSLSSFRSGPLYKINMATQRQNCCLESCHLSKIIQNKDVQVWFFRSSLSLIFGGVFSWTLKQIHQFWGPAIPCLHIPGFEPTKFESADRRRRGWPNGDGITDLGLSQVHLKKRAGKPQKLHPYVW